MGPYGSITGGPIITLVVPLVHLVPIAGGTTCAPCPHHLWCHLCTLSPSLMVPLAHLVPMVYDTTCGRCFNP